MSMNGLVTFIKDQAPGQFDSIVQRIPDADIRDFVRQTFVATGWYDFLPILHLASAAAALLRVPTAELLVDHAKWQVQKDLHGANKLLAAKLITPEAMVARSADIRRRYYDFCDLEVVSCAPGVLVTAVSRLPEILVPWFKVVPRAAQNALMCFAGAENNHVTYSPCKPDGETHGVPLVKLTARRTWTHKETPAKP
jgi:hypothetical protein